MTSNKYTISIPSPADGHRKQLCLHIPAFSGTVQVALPFQSPEGC